MYGRENTVLGSNFQNSDFDGFTRFDVLNPKITFLAVGLYMLVCLHMPVYKHYSKTNYSGNSKFDILHLYHMLIATLKLFIKIG